MFKLKEEKPKYPIKKLTLKEKEELSLAEWCWNSHFWVVLKDGYSKCEWCGNYWTDQTPLTKEYNVICKGNPVIKVFLRGK